MLSKGLLALESGEKNMCWRLGPGLDLTGSLRASKNARNNMEPK